MTTLWTIPNALGLFRLAATPVLVALVLLHFPGAGLLAFALFVPAAVSDIFDGLIARARGQVSTFGVFLDLTADKVLVAGLLIALVPSGLAPAWLVIVLLVRELVVGGVRQMAASEQVVVAAQTLGKSKTLVNLVAIGILLLAFDARSGGPTAGIGIGPVLETVGGWLLVAALVLAVVSGIDYLRGAWPVLIGEEGSDAGDGPFT